MVSFFSLFLFINFFCLGMLTFPFALFPLAMASWTSWWFMVSFFFSLLVFFLFSFRLGWGRY
jgi:hypothetical protein